MSDEYGPYIYRFDPSGNLLQTIQPPAAVVPMINGKVNFTSESGPDTGRTGNQGEAIIFGRFHSNGVTQDSRT